VQFKARNASAGQQVFLGIESCYETNAVDWVTNAVVTNLTEASYTSYVVTNLLNPASNQMIRLRKYSSGFGYGLGLDDIIVSYPPANVAFSDVFINPGYPSTGSTVKVTCEVTSINPMFPAYGILPTVWYRRRANDTAFTSLPMSRISGSRYETLDALPIPAVQARDTEVEYYVRAVFRGYHASESEDRSPQNYPAGGIARPTNYVVRAFASTYTNVAAVISGQSQSGRLLSNGTWQSIVNLTGTTNTLVLGLNGYGHNVGQGVSPTEVTWGNSNQWQTALPLADSAGTNQTAITIAGSFPAGQYLVRFDEATGNYLVLRCVWQDFDKPGEGDGTVYKQTVLSGNSVGGGQQDFDAWPKDETRTRTESFEGDPWTNYVSSYTNAVGGGNAWLIYSSRVTNVGAPQYNAIRTVSNAVNNSTAFAVQASHWGLGPLRGIGQITYSYAASTTNTSASLGVYLCPTNPFPEPPTYTTNYLDFQLLDGYWSASTPVSSVYDFTNTTFSTTNLVLATNKTFDVIFSQISGNQSIYLDSLSISDWFSKPLTTNADGWVGSGYYIETNAVTANSNCCRLDVTRAVDPTNQFIRSPLLTSGIKYIEFFYSGTCFSGSPSNNAIGFNVELSYGNPNVWTNILDSITTNFSNNAATNYYYYRRLLQTTTPNLYVRIKNTTPRPGALLLDRISIPGFATTNDWSVNNAAVDYDPYQTPPLPRQFYAGTCYLNNTRATNQMATGLEFPDTNRYPSVRTPLLSDGVGEVSFWYRNWATTAPVTPARLVIQSAQQDTGNEGDWDTTIATITNIVNTNDYLYFSASVYSPASRYVRIFNDDLYTSSVGRVCIDDILVTAPMAASLSMSNLIVTPPIPLATNTVDVSIDVYSLFLNPTLTALNLDYGTATNYAGLGEAEVFSLPMTCIASNLSVPGKWYRFKTTTPIPTNKIDTFVKYAARASFDGYHSEATSPSTNRGFGVYPTWLAPLDSRYGTNMAYYIVFSCPTGTVWINEINVRDAISSLPKYVELCGLADVSLRDWVLQTFSSAAATQGVYTITNGYVLNNTTNGYGFWLLGDTNTPNADMTLTNSPPLPTPSGGIRLLRNTGVFADSIAYGTSASTVSSLTNKGFRYIGNDTSGNISPLTMRGTGSVNSAFSWVNSGSNTPRSINPDQVLIGFYENPNPIEPPALTIVAFRINTNIWIECTATNGWRPTPWYSTNLVMTNGWTMLSDFGTTYPTPSPSNTFSVNFVPASNNTPYFYTIVPTNDL
jgi:hypothetical protein